MPTKALAFWRQFAEYRSVKITMMVYYVIALLGGVVTLAMPPSTISQILGEGSSPLVADFLNIAWGGFFLLGGLLGLIAVMPGWWWLEKLGIRCIWTSIAIYFLCVFPLHFLAEGNRLTQADVILMASGIFVLRYLMIRKYRYEPRASRE